MKNILILVLVTLLTMPAPLLAQTKEPCLKLSNIVVVEDYSEDLLFHNAHNYLNLKEGKKKSDHHVIEDSEAHLVYIPQEIVVYSGGMTQHPIGHLQYEYRVEVKEEKYRYTFANIIYIPYSRNRYGRYVPVSGKKFPIEVVMSNPKFRNREVIIEYIDHFSKLEAEKLDLNMRLSEHAENIKTIDW
jgi:hypothetical protein